MPHYCRRCDKRLSWSERRFPREPCLDCKRKQAVKSLSVLLCLLLLLSMGIAAL